MGVLSPVEDWLSFVVSSRPAQTTLAAKVLAGEDKAAGIYLMMVLGEISMAICILTLASRPGIYAATIHYYHDDFASNPSVKRGRLGLFFFVMPFMFCWVLIKTTGEGNIDYFSCFFPGFYIFAPISLSLGWQMLFVDADPHKDQSRH